MPAKAISDASASVENPVRPCPIEQPNAITPPAPISAAPPPERSMWRGDWKPSKWKRPVNSAVARLPANTPNTVTIPKFSVDPVDSMTYCNASAIGAMKVSEVTGVGLKSSAPR